MRKVLIDCQECIPCNPCVSVCPTGAITIAGGLTGLPAADLAKCTGCALCVAACPGQACFVVDEEFAPGLSTVDLPYEYDPVPETGAVAEARNNDGKILCAATVVKVTDLSVYKQTRVVRVSVPKEFAAQVRGIGIDRKGE